ncbi:MAG: hypothetical protein GY816_21275 [Cytophagales bacterium]|nr:hypothetical protein [Cytophagales bacterium]
MNRSSYQISLFLITLALVGCHRPPEFPETPKIKFERLHLTDTSTLILDFNLTDGDGDIGLDVESERISDSYAPYHSYSIIANQPNSIETITDGNRRYVIIHDEFFVSISDELVGPYYSVPVVLIPLILTLNKGIVDGQQITETVTFLGPSSEAGAEFMLTEDPIPDSGYRCEDYEIMSFFTVSQQLDGDGNVISESLNEEIDTVLVQRNPFHFNIYIDLLVKQGNDYITYQEFVPALVSECDPLFTSRFPVFDRSDFGRPLDGSISYAFFSTQFATDNSFILNETLRLRFYIYDRALNQSNVVETPDFKILDLRTGDLVGN